MLRENVRIQRQQSNSTTSTTPKPKIHRPSNIFSLISVLVDEVSQFSFENFFFFSTRFGPQEAITQSLLPVFLGQILYIYIVTTHEGRRGESQKERKVYFETRRQLEGIKVLKSFYFKTVFPT